MIEVKELSKRYGNVEAVMGVSFSVGKDQVLGFLGPNGAGKTTIMKILTGYHYPTGGAAFVDGLSVQEQSVAVKARIGYLPEGVPLYGDLTVDEYLGFVADARLIAKGERSAKIGAAVEACGLGGMRGRRIETLSKGYKQRTGLAGAIVHDPPILILDEPTTGLDPNQIIEIRNLIKELGKRKTVILSTHILQEVEAVCNQVLILNEGKIAAQGTPEEIAVSMKGGVSWRLRLKAGGGSGGKPAVESALASFAAAHGAENQTVDQTIDEKGGIFEAAFLARNTGERSGGEDRFAEELFDWAVARDYKILSMSRQRLTLEDIFVQLTHDDHAARNDDNGDNDDNETTEADRK
jgi:ABC-2 type transport system ATP-binding protein